MTHRTLSVLLLSLVFSCLVGCAGSGATGAVVVSPSAMTTVDDWSDSELADDVAREHLTAAAGRSFHRQTAPDSELRFSTDVAILVLSPTVAVCEGSTRTLKRGAVLEVPAGTGVHFDSDAEVEVLVVGAEQAASVAPPTAQVAGR